MVISFGYAIWPAILPFALPWFFVTSGRFVIAIVSSEEKTPIHVHCVSKVFDHLLLYALKLPLIQAVWMGQGTRVDPQTWKMRKSFLMSLVITGMPILNNLPIKWSFWRNSQNFYFSKKGSVSPEAQLFKIGMSSDKDIRKDVLIEGPAPPTPPVFRVVS